DLLEADAAIDHWKARGVDLSGLLAPPDAPADVPRRRVREQDPVLDTHRDHELIEQAMPALEKREPVDLTMKVRNRHRTVGGLLSGEVARRHGAEGLPDDTIVVNLEGSGGQSFGAWLAPGITFALTGDANDFVGKGLSGGVLSVRPPADATYVAEENVLIGNTVLYGATAGRAFFRGLAGERFGVRNSGVDAVVEGVGDHGCEYMTGGRVVVLGPTGRNFAAGMSGGIAYVLDPESTFEARCNTELVQLEEMEHDDFEKVHALVEEHAHRTGSSVAERVLGDWDALRGAWVKVMPMDYKRALREEAERRGAEAGEPAVIGERGNGDGGGPVRAGQGDSYPAQVNGEHETARTGEAGQHEDAAVAAQRAERDARRRGAAPGEEEQIEEEAAEEVLPSNG
ncbi:MAG: glutamate synthase large chain, partial [Thermoleophilaceae bacterium]|nr:glutamate synthase large chain [Thermoleophilaceae bacterium]